MAKGGMCSKKGESITIKRGRRRSEFWQHFLGCKLGLYVLALDVPTVYIFFNLLIFQRDELQTGNMGCQLGYN
jgi:hypothetical protein